MYNEMLDQMRPQHSQLEQLAGALRSTAFSSSLRLLLPMREQGRGMGGWARGRGREGQGVLMVAAVARGGCEV